MSKLLAFHNDEAIKKKYVDRVKNHMKLDNIIQGSGWNGTKGCAIGCTFERYDSSLAPSEIGMPEWMAKLEDTIHEGLTVEESKLWPLRVLESIKPGVDLNSIQPEMMIFILQSTLDTFDHEKTPDVKKAVETVIDLWRGDAAYADAAANAAAYAAYAADADADAAAYAAYTDYADYADYTADAADAAAAAYADAAAAKHATYKKFADKLIELISGLEQWRGGKDE